MRIATLALVRITAYAACAVAAFGLGPATAQSESASSPPADAQHSLSSFAQAWAALGAYSTIVTAFERKGSDAAQVTLDYTFHKPTDVLIHILAGPNAGTHLRWDGGETITGWRGSGLLALFKKTFSLHDTTVETTRGLSIDQLSFGAILTHAQHEPGKLEAAPPDEVDGVKADVITLSPADPAHDGGLTREVVELSQTTHLPLRVLGYDGTELVRKVDFSKVTLQD